MMVAQQMEMGGKMGIFRLKAGHLLVQNLICTALLLLHQSAVQQANRDQ